MADVVEALVELRSGTKDQLEEKSGHTDAPTYHRIPWRQLTDRRHARTNDTFRRLPS